MITEVLQGFCEVGQRQLMHNEYVEAERTLAAAEQQAWDERDFDTLARLYMPLQEARRQRRQKCGEGMVCLDLIANTPEDRIDGRHVVENYPFGQLLVAGWASIEPAKQVRELAAAHNLYLETFLAAVYPTPDGPVVLVVPGDDVSLPKAGGQTADALARVLPPHCLLLREHEIPPGVRQGTAQTYAQVMAMWERLHTPFLKAADAQLDPISKIESYRRTIRVDYACELAHQRLAEVARALARGG
jgi:hypothetical protein